MDKTPKDICVTMPDPDDPGDDDKHGYYAVSFFASELKRLDKTVLGKLDDETVLMRSLILRTAICIKNENENMGLDESLAALRGMTHAVGRVESIYRTQKVVDKGVSSIELAFEELKYLPFEQD